MSLSFLSYLSSILWSQQYYVSIEESLPDDCMQHIFTVIDHRMYPILYLVNKRWKRILDRMNVIFNRASMRKLFEYATKKYHLEILNWCRAPKEDWNTKKIGKNIAKSSKFQLLDWYRREKRVDFSGSFQKYALLYLDIEKTKESLDYVTNVYFSFVLGALRSSSDEKVSFAFDIQRKAYGTTSRCYKYAAMGNNKKVLMMFRSKGIAEEGMTIRGAIKSGSKDMLEWAIKQGFDVPEDAISYSLRNNNLSFVDYFLKMGIEMGDKLKLTKIGKYEIKTFEKAFELGVKPESIILWETMGEEPKIEVLEFLIDRGAIINDCTFARAIENGDLKTVEWLFKKTGKFSKLAGNIAASKGAIKLLNWLELKGYVPEKKSLNMTCIFYKTDVIEWLVKKDWISAKDHEKCTRKMCQKYT